MGLATGDVNVNNASAWLCNRYQIQKYVCTDQRTNAAAPWQLALTAAKRLKNVAVSTSVQLELLTTIPQVVFIQAIEARTSSNVLDP